MLFTTIFVAAAAATTVVAAPVDNGKYINFYKGFTQVASDNIKFGDKVTVNYDLDRVLPLCKATVATVNATVTAFYTSGIAGVTSNVQSTTLFNSQEGAPLLQQQTFTISSVPASDSLSFWFSCSVNNTAPQYDSNYGKNFVFPLVASVINFDAGYTHSVKGDIKVGTPIIVNYDHTRAPCKFPQYDIVEHITGYYFYTGSKETQQSTVYSAYYAGRAGPSKISYPIVIEAPQAGEIQFYFGCQTNLESGWDSNLGKNWKFTISA
ncbi:hypothetical protein HDU97_008099 [Phlyctochytrium planicorne]|nr:hypothetical protein HDU97_008099 [Phlyctochytrium planicorne]